MRVHPDDTRAPGELAVELLARSGVDGVQALLRAEPRERHRAAMKLHDVLAGLQQEDRLAILRDVDLSEGVLAELLADPRGLVRSVVVRLAGYSGKTRWIPMLVGLIQEDGDAFVRQRAVEALGNLGAIEAIPLLAAIADSTVSLARHHAIRALGQMLPLAARDLMSVALDHSDTTSRRIAAETLARHADRETWALFLDAAFSARPLEVRKSLVVGFGCSRAARAAIPIVRTLIDDPSPEVRIAAAEALTALRDQRTLGALFECALYDPFSVPRAEHPDAVAAVSRSGGREYPVREAAAEALLVLGGEQAWDELASPPCDLVALPADSRG
jgi:HEAT repeat protein